MKKYSHIITFGLLFIVMFGVGGSVWPNVAHADDCSASNPLAYLNPACGPLTPSGWKQAGADVIGSVVTPIAILVLKIVSLITGLSGIILNYVVNYTVVNVAENYGKISAIDTAWGTLRDIANMGFIFVLLYASIQMILGVGKDTRKLIVNIVIAAILINFSLFFTKVVIDASNLLAVTFYNAMVPGGTAGTPDQILNTGLSNALMEPLSLQSIWSMAGGLDPSNLATIGVMGSIVSLIAAFVFFAIAMMFVIRYVVLIFVLILSPIAFVSWVIPGIEGVWGKWKDALLNQAFFAPLYMLLTWITINIFQHMPKGTGTLADALTGSMKTVNGQDVINPDSASLLFNFVVVIVFLIATLILSKNMANKAGGMVSKMTGAAMGFAGGATLGLVGYAGRRTIGAKAVADLNNEDLKKRAAEGSIRARLQLAAASKAAKGSFDLRGTGLNDSLGAGKAGGKGGREQMIKDEAKKKEEFAKSLAPADTVIDRAKQDRDEAKEKEKKVRATATTTVDSTLKKPEVLVKLENDIQTAKKLSENPSLSVDSRAGALKRMAELEEQAKPIQEAHEARRQRGIEQLVSSSGVEEKVRSTQEKVDKLTGVDKKEFDNRQKALNEEEKTALGKDPNLKKEKDLDEQVKNLVNQINKASDAQKEALNKELIIKNQEFEIAKKQSVLSQKAISEEYKTRREAIKETKGIGELRTQSRALNISNPGLVSLDRVFLVGAVKQSSLQAAANLRKGKKPVKEQLEAILKEAGDIKDEKKDEGGAKEKTTESGEEKPKE